MAGILVRLPLPHLFSKAESPVIRRLDSVQIWRWVLVGFWAAMGCPGLVAAIWHAPVAAVSQSRLWGPT